MKTVTFLQLWLRQKVGTSYGAIRHRQIFRFVFPALDGWPVPQEEVSTNDKT